MLRGHKFQFLTLQLIFFVKGKQGEGMKFEFFAEFFDAYQKLCSEIADFDSGIENRF